MRQPIFPSWVEQAARLPLSFAQVREDVEIDREALRMVGRPARVMMVASGGCTAAALAAEPNISHLHLVDSNPAQIALSRLKLRLLKEAAPRERLALLGHAPMDAAERWTILRGHLQELGLRPDCLGPQETLANLGPDHAGRYEFLFSALRRRLALKPDIHSAYRTVMRSANIIRLFGNGARQDTVLPFPDHFAARTIAALRRPDAKHNPYLAQILQGRFPSPGPIRWLSLVLKNRLPETLCTVAGMSETLDGMNGEIDFLHLSNITDWMSAEDAARLLTRAEKAMRKDAVLIVRRLNSTHDIPALGPRFKWLERTSETFRKADRSFLYAGLHIGRKL